MPWIVLLLVLALSAPARAATVRARISDSIEEKQASLRFVTWEVTDRDGAANAFVIRRVAGGIEVADAHRLRPGRACRRVSARLVRCRAPRLRGAETITDVHVRAGAGNDVVTVRGLSAAVHAQAGDDRITSDGPARLHGGAGADRIDGSPFDDHLQGDSGADAIDGGDGVDVAMWPRSRAVHASLATGRAVSAGETDTLAGIENLMSGSAADVLEGDAGANSLLSGQGADRVFGGDGDDVIGGDHQENARVQRAFPDHLDGGAGNDTINGRGGGDTYLGGPGDDEVMAGATLAPSGETPDGTAERVDCAEGDDKVLEPDAADLVEATCELVDYSGGGVPAPSYAVPPLTTGDDWAVRGTLHCDAEFSRRCPARIVLADAAEPARVLGSLETELTGGEERAFTLPLTPEGREEVRRRGSLTARLTITTNHMTYRDVPFAATLRLSAPG